MESVNYADALKAYLDARNAYYEVYRHADTYGGLVVSEILANKVALTEKYILADNLIKMGAMYDIEGLYLEALNRFKEAEEIIKTMGDLDLRKDVMTRILDVETKISSEAEVQYVRQIKDLMERAEKSLDYPLALQYADFVLNVYSDLGVQDSEAQADKMRIQNKIELEKRADNYITSARSAASAARYDDAIRDFTTALELYDEMEIPSWHEKYMEVMAEIKDTDEKKKALEDVMAEPPVIEVP
jgi:tetratricopeptide (TPR) repeat protein